MLDKVRHSNCYHCNAPNPVATALVVDIEGQQQTVCCPGCLAAVHFIQELNLESFYRHREKCNVDAALNAANIIQGTDELDIVTRDLGNGQSQLDLLIPDIRCVACVWLLEQALNKLAGVTSVTVNFGSRRLQAVFTPATSAQTIARTIQRLGYEVRPDLPDAARESFQSTRRTMLIRLGVAGIGMMQVMMFAIASYIAGPGTLENPASGMDPLFETLMRWASLAITTPVVLYSAFPFHRGALYALRNRNLTMDVPVSIAILAAWILSIHSTITLGAEVYFDTACMFTFFLLIGRYLELLSRHHFQESTDLLQSLLPQMVTRVSDNAFNTEHRIRYEDMRENDLLKVQKNEIIPADAIVVKGSSQVSESTFTGEPLPLVKTAGSRVLAGSMNYDGELLIRVRTDHRDFLIKQISRLYAQASSYRPRWSQLADRTATWFVGAVLIIAAGAGTYWYLAGAGNFAVIALTVLVVACPCALSLATPVAYTVATTTLRRHGVVMKNGAFLERAANTTALVFDKTGTLTAAELSICEIVSPGTIDEKICLQIATTLERHSEHPIAHAFQAETQLLASAVEVVPGMGVSGTIDGVEYRIGQPAFALPHQHLAAPDHEGLWVLLASSQPLAWFRLQDELREEAPSVMKDLQQRGFYTAIFTGDNSGEGKAQAESLATDLLQTSMSPEQKVLAVRALSESGQRIMMIGDGINDAGAMAVADTSIAISPRDAFVQTSADATLLNNSLHMIPAVLTFARKCQRIIRQNVTWSIVYNFTVIPFAIMGLLPPWLAALGMSLSSVLVVLNAGRLRRMEV